MHKNSSIRRKEKKARIAKKKKERLNKKNKIDKNGSNVHLMKMPFANISAEKRKEFVKVFQEENIKIFEESLVELQELLSKYNPLLILSFLTNYNLMAFTHNNEIKILGEEYRINQSDIEICQALILQINSKELKFEIPLGNTYNKVQELLGKLTLSNHYKQMAPEILDMNDEESAIKFTQEYVKMHTQTVRNWGSFEQVKIISSEIYEKCDELLINNYGFNSSNVICVFNHLIKKSEKMANVRFENLQKLSKIKNSKNLLDYYLELINNEIQDKDETYQYMILKKPKEVLLWIMSHYDLRLTDQYTFNIDNIADELNIEKSVIINIVKNFGFNFGELESFQTEHIFLGNPIWSKPIILLSNDEFFCPMPQMFFSFILKSFDNLIDKIDKEQLSDIKAEYLENKIEEIVKSKFPHENTINIMKWKFDDHGEIKEYETDLITFIDNYIIIFEAKSGKIDDSSLRGAPKRLKRDIEKLLLEPNIQSKRLKDRLEYLVLNPEVHDELREKLNIDLTKVNKVLRVSITLEYFASLQSNIFELENTGWIPNDYEPCPTMNIADFETLYDIFDNPTQIINYLEMREELERHIKYKGDELDLIALYMDNHLNLADINPEFPLMITGMSKKIDDYYELKNTNPEIKKPVPKMNKYFEKILNQVEDRKPDGWIQIGSIIYRLFPDDQIKIINMLYKIKNNVRKNWMIRGHENILVYVPPKSSKYAFSFAVFCDKNKEKRQEFIEEAIAIGLESEHVEYCLGIGINIDRSDIPYAMIAMSKKENK